MPSELSAMLAYLCYNLKSKTAPSEDRTSWSNTEYALTPQVRILVPHGALVCLELHREPPYVLSNPESESALVSLCPKVYNRLPEPAKPGNLKCCSVGFCVLV